MRTVLRIWRGALLLAFFLLIFGTTLTGYTFPFEVFGIRFSPFGAFLLIRAVIQLVLARRNLRRMKKVRLIIIWAVEQLAGTSAELEQLKQQWRYGYPEFLVRLEKAVPGINDRWEEVVEVIQSSYKLPSIEIVVPIYGIENEREMLNTLEGLSAQSYPPRQVRLNLNDPKNDVMRTFIPQWIRNQADARWIFNDLPEPGKRGAMAEGFIAHHQNGADISVNVDADVIPHRDAALITALTKVMFPETTGVTSNVQVIIPDAPRKANGRKQSLWSRFWRWFLLVLTFFRYKYANDVERSAQSVVGGVICLSGPWMGVTNSVMMTFLPEWLGQTFLGKLFAPGDDRRVSWFLNLLGLPVYYQPDIVTWTEAPDNLRRYKQQQLRWNQSAQANAVNSITTGQITAMPLWSGIDTLYTMFFTYTLMMVAGGLIYNFASALGTSGIDLAWEMVKQYVFIFLALNIFRGVYAAVTNHDWRGLIIMFYPLLFLRVQMPIKLVVIRYPVPQKWTGRKGN